MQSIFLLLLLFGYSFCSSEVVSEEKPKDDPSLHPGHMQPLGSFRPQSEIETLHEYPTPQDFFTNFIKPGRPFLLKKGAMNQGAYKLWNDEYFLSFPEAADEMVQVEPNLKEVREATGFDIPFKEFVQRYHKEKIYMVNKVPSFLRKDILMPAPLRCNNTRKLMLDHVTWMSTGGTKSVLHNDDLDNINCLFRGSKELLFINPFKYGSKVPIDRPRGGYSSLDVDKVNFTKYPGLKDVEYIHCLMEEGDCLFIPYRWYHQVNSVANDKNENIAVNIWFRHDENHVPEDCDVPEEKASLDNWDFDGVENVYGGDDDEMQPYPLLDLFEMTLNKTKYHRASFKTFISILTKVQGIFVEQSIADIKPTKEFLLLAKDLFDKLNVIEGQYIDRDDFDQIEQSKSSNSIESWLATHMNKMQDVLREQLMREGLNQKDESLFDEAEKAVSESSDEDGANDASDVTTNDKKEEL